MIEYDRQKLGKFLKEIRENAGFTQAEASKRIGYSSAQFVSNIERGISAAPLSTLAKMISLYKADPDRLMKIILESQRALLRQKIS